MFLKISFMNIVEKKWLFIVVLLVALSVSILIVYWIFGEQFAQEFPQNVPPSSIILPTSTTSPAQNNITDGVKTYTNTEFGFEFKYPEDWEFEENTFSNPFSKFNLEVALPKDKQTPNAITINIVAPDFVDRQFSDLQDIASKVIVDGVEGLKYEYTDQAPHITIILPLGKYKIILGTIIGHRDILNQILATFKFLK